jgi:hypothetical protein
MKTDPRTGVALPAPEAAVRRALLEQERDTLRERYRAAQLWLEEAKADLRKIHPREYADRQEETQWAARRLEAIRKEIRDLAAAVVPPVVQGPTRAPSHLLYGIARLVEELLVESDGPQRSEEAIEDALVALLEELDEVRPGWRELPGAVEAGGKP